MFRPNSVGANFEFFWSNFRLLELIAINRNGEIFFDNGEFVHIFL